MTKDSELFTESLGDQYEKQGSLREAKEVYSLLLNKDPENSSFIEALERIDKRIAAEKRAVVVSVVGEWLELLVALRNEGERIIRKGQG